MKYLFPALIVFLSLAITSCDRTTPLMAGACYPYCSIESRPELTLKTEQYLRSNKTKAFINTASLLAGNLYYVRPTDEDQALRWWMKIAEIAGDSDKVNYELIKHYKKKKKIQ